MKWISHDDRKWKCLSLWALTLAVLFVSPSCRSYAATTLPFEGEIDLTAKTLEVVFDIDAKRYCVVRAARPTGKEITIQLLLEHVQTPLFDLSSDVQITIERKLKKSEALAQAWQDLDLLRDGWISLLTMPTQGMVGTLNSRYTLLDYQPVKGLSARFTTKDDRFFLTSFSVGHVDGHGHIDLKDAYPVDLAFHLSGIPMTNFLDFWLMKKNKYESLGLVYGDIQVTGSLGRPYLRGNLESLDGFVDKLRFQSLQLHAEGYFPHLDISKSVLSQPDGWSFTFEGPVDMSDKKNFKKQLKALKLSPLVQASSSESEWTLKRREEDSGSTALKYFLREEDPSGRSSEEESAIIGIEKRMEF